MGGLLQQKAYSQQRALSSVVAASGGGPTSSRVWSVIIPSICSGTPALEARIEIRGNPFIQTVDFQIRQKPFMGFQGVWSSVAWAGAASLTEQADRVERRWTQHVDPTTDSRREQSQTRRSRSQEIGSVLQWVEFVQCPGESLLPQTATPWFSRFWLCYETCE